MPGQLGAGHGCKWGDVDGGGAAADAARQQPETSEPQTQTVNRQFDGRGFVDDVATGDWISIHWGWACQILDERQVANLEAWTAYHLRLANQTL